MKNYENVVIFQHPLIRHKVAILRDEKTSTKEFRELIEEITTLMTYEVLREGVPTSVKTVKTPLETCEQTVVADNAIAIVPILRAGLGTDSSAKIIVLPNGNRVYIIRMKQISLILFIFISLFPL